MYYRGSGSVVFFNLTLMELYMTHTPMKSTTYKSFTSRKTRRPEPIRFYVKWIQGNTMYFQAFKRDNAAVRFQNRLIDDGVVRMEDVRIVMV
jgi:hypothetical protein